MRETLHNLLATPIDVGWKVLTVLTLLSVLEMSRTILRRVGHLLP